MSIRKINLSLRQSDFEALFHVVENARGKRVMIDRHVLRCLLKDHGALHGAAIDARLKLIEPDAQDIPEATP